MPRAYIETFTCDAPGCGQLVTDGEKFSLYAGVAEWGKGSSSFSCDQGNHWACSPEHALAALQDCINNHLLPAAERKRKEHADV